jgi:hypothetical protein
MTGAARVAMVCAAGLLMAAAVGKVTSGQGFPKPTIQEGPVEIRGSVTVTNPVEIRGSVTVPNPVEARQSGPWSVALDERARVRIAPPSFVQADRTYEFRWSEADRWERYRVINVSADGWVLAEAQSPGAARGQQYLNVTRAVAIVRVGS